MAEALATDQAEMDQCTKARLFALSLILQRNAARSLQFLGQVVSSVDPPAEVRYLQGQLPPSLALSPVGDRRLPPRPFPKEIAMKVFCSWRQLRFTVILRNMVFQGLANPGAKLLFGFDFVLLGLAKKFVEFFVPIQGAGRLAWNLDRVEPLTAE